LEPRESRAESPTPPFWTRVQRPLGARVQAAHSGSAQQALSQAAEEAEKLAAPRAVPWAERSAPPAVGEHAAGTHWDDDVAATAGVSMLAAQDVQGAVEFALGWKLPRGQARHSIPLAEDWVWTRPKPGPQRATVHSAADWAPLAGVSVMLGHERKGEM
jgi:hypothetical protein